MKCPMCGGESERLLALSRKDNKTMICDTCGQQEAWSAFIASRPISRPSHYERTRAQVYATGNRWAIENFEATH